MYHKPSKSSHHDHSDRDKTHTAGLLSRGAKSEKEPYASNLVVLTISTMWSLKRRNEKPRGPIAVDLENNLEPQQKETTRPNHRIFALGEIDQRSWPVITPTNTDGAGYPARLS